MVYTCNNPHGVCWGKKDSQGHAIAVFFGKSEIRRDLQGRNLRRFSLLLDLTALLRSFVLFWSHVFC